MSNSTLTLGDLQQSMMKDVASWVCSQDSLSVTSNTLPASGNDDSTVVENNNNLEYLNGAAVTVHSDSSQSQDNLLPACRDTDACSLPSSGSVTEISAYVPKWYTTPVLRNVCSQETAPVCTCTCLRKYETPLNNDTNIPMIIIDDDESTVSVASRESWHTPNCGASDTSSIVEITQVEYAEDKLHLKLDLDDDEHPTDTIHANNNNNNTIDLTQNPSPILPIPDYSTHSFYGQSYGSYYY